MVLASAAAPLEGPGSCCACGEEAGEVREHVLLREKLRLAIRNFFFSCHSHHVLFFFRKKLLKRTD
jgi:hypothetical protein